MKIRGLHHITLVCRDAQRTVDFYTRTLGLRMIKLTVNFDDPGSYHLYFANDTADPGSAITFFVWPDAGRGRPGIGGTHHFALTVGEETGLLKWKRWLTGRGVSVDGPFNRKYFHSIYFHDPDGTTIEIATQGPGLTLDEDVSALGSTAIVPPSGDVIRRTDNTWPEPIDAISNDMRLNFGMHHISAICTDLGRTHDFFHGVLGMRRVKMAVNLDDPAVAHWFWGSDDGRPGTLISYFQYTARQMRQARVGWGQTHHFALAVKDDAEQDAYRQRLVEAGFRASPMIDRLYFHSVYSSDPDGHIVELATLGPGFTADEPLEELGTSLRLPPWYEPRRAQIEARLPRVELPAHALLK